MNTRTRPLSGNNRLAYDKPSLMRHQTGGLANKFGRAPSRESLTSIDGVAVSDLIAEHGSPLYVFSERRIRQRFREVHRAFALRYPKVQFAWSYKTNYLDAICDIFHSEGSWAEVVSDFEYDLARRNGIPGEHILFNGPYKPDEALRTAIAEGAKLHIDHFDELYAVERIARDLGREVPVALRINLDTGGASPRWDRFGFNLDNGEAMDAIRRMKAGGHLTLSGLHCHIGTFITDPGAYGRAASKLAHLALDARAEAGWVVDYLDMGGGIASRATLHAQYAPGSDSTPPVDDYAEAITRAILTAGFAPEDLPTLFLESGRTLIDDAGFMITSVVANKRLSSGKRSVVVDAGVNVLFTSFWYRHDIVPVVDRGGMLEDTIVYGPLCMNIDVVRPSVLLPPMQPGDPLVIRTVGAYNVTQSMQFIRLRPAVVLITSDGSVQLIRHAETLNDVKRTERRPARLAE